LIESCIVEGMPTDRPSSASAVAQLIRDHLRRHPEIGGLRGFSEKTHISYHSLQKYAKGSNLPPIEKWNVLASAFQEPIPDSSDAFLFAHIGPSQPHGDLRMTKENGESQNSVAPSEAKANPLQNRTSSISYDELPSKREDRQEFYLPVHRFIWFYPEEVAIINHPAFQRLSGMHQLGMAHIVYPGATHRRFEHALGTVWVAQRMLEAVTHNCAKKPEQPSDVRDEWIRGQAPSLAEERLIRLGALLHDIGHVPFGHTFEDELHLLNKHDEAPRIDRIFDKNDWFGADALQAESVVTDDPDPYLRIRETLRQRIDRLYRKYLPVALRNEFSASTLIKEVLIKPSADESEGEKTHRLSQGAAAARCGIRINICRDIVGNTICADLLDYLHRDWYHIGKQRYFDERIFHYMEIRTPKTNLNLELGSSPPPTEDDAFVIAIGSWPRLRSDGISAILELLESRYQLAEAVLFHRTKMAATSMLERTLSLAFSSENQTIPPFDLEGWLLNNPEELLFPTILSNKHPLDVVGDTSIDRKKQWKRSQKLASKLLRRELHELLLMVAYDEVKGRDADFIQRTYADGKDAAVNRIRAVRRLEEDFGLESGAVTMYCPESRMNRKIAAVQLFVENCVSAFDAYEEAHNDPLSAGHLRAQLNRFKSLWRIVFFIDPTVRAEKGDKFVSNLIRSIRVQLLRLQNREESMNSAIADIAQNLVQIPSFHLYGKPVLSEPKEMKIARSGTVSGTDRYPSETPSLLRFIGE
jgi:HD superfamily phosphohydrolase